MLNGFANASSEQALRIIRNIEEMQKMIDPSFKPSRFHLHRNKDHLLEYFAPLVEIDKVARTYAYLAGKGRRLVRGSEENVH